MRLLGLSHKEQKEKKRQNETIKTKILYSVYIEYKINKMLKGRKLSPYNPTAQGETFLRLQTYRNYNFGPLLAFAMGTAGGVLFGKAMYWWTKGKVNPLNGSAGVSAVPMAARASQKVGQRYSPANYLLMHAMARTSPVLSAPQWQPASFWRSINKLKRRICQGYDE